MTILSWRGGGAFPFFKMHEEGRESRVECTDDEHTLGFTPG